MTMNSWRHDISNNPQCIGSKMHLVATPNAFVAKKLRSTDKAWSLLGLMCQSRYLDCSPQTSAQDLGR
jgi:hypothetical protein